MSNRLARSGFVVLVASAMSCSSGGAEATKLGEVRALCDTVALVGS